MDQKYICNSAPECPFKVGDLKPKRLDSTKQPTFDFKSTRQSDIFTEFPSAFAVL